MGVGAFENHYLRTCYLYLGASLQGPLQRLKSSLLQQTIDGRQTCRERYAGFIHLQSVPEVRAQLTRDLHRCGFVVERMFTLRVRECFVRLQHWPRDFGGLDTFRQAAWAYDHLLC